MNLENILQKSRIVGVCPGNDVETNMKYQSTVAIHNPDEHNIYMIFCPICKKSHQHTEIPYLRFMRDEKWHYINKK